MDRRLALLFVASALSASACRSCSSSSTTTTTTDAGRGEAGLSDAANADLDAATSAPSAASQRTLRVVATRNIYNADESSNASVDLDGTIYVFSGGLVYEAERDGVLAPIAPPEAFAPTMPADAIPMVGFETGDDDPIMGAAKDTSGTLHLYGRLRAFVLNNGERQSDASADVDGGSATLSLSPNVTKVNGERVVSFRGGLLTINYQSGANPLAWAGPPPKGASSILRAKTDPTRRISYGEVTVARDGTLVGLSGRTPDVTIWRPDAALDAGELITLVDRPDAAHTILCKVAPAFDGNVYVCCDELMDLDQTYTPTLHRLVGGGFERAFPSIPIVCETPPSIDREGNLYRVKRLGNRARIDRCLAPATDPDACEPIDVEVPKPPPHPPHYTLGFENVRDDKGGRWLELYIHDRAVEMKDMFISAVYARSRDDVWAIGHEGVFHMRGRPEAGVTLPNRTDARVLVRNERPPTRWTGPCDQVFVRLGSAANVQTIVERHAQIVTALGGRKGPPVDWKLVTGRLHDREVTGVVVWRNEYNWKREEMTQAVERLVAAFTDNPMNVPEVTCTLPVLSRVLDPDADSKRDR